MEKNISKTIKRWKYKLLIMNLHIICDSSSGSNEWTFKITPKTRK